MKKYSTPKINFESIELFERIADTNLVLSFECLQSLSKIVITTNSIIKNTAWAAIGFPSFTTVFAYETMRVQQ